MCIPIRKTDIQSKLETIPEGMEKLEFLQARGFQESYIDFRNRDFTLHRLQPVIQALVDIGEYIIAQLGLKKPGFNADLIQILIEAGYINAQDNERYINMLEFRNRTEHLNRRVDMDRFTEMMCQEINNIRALYEIFYKVIETHEDSDCF